jgi:hypothetical protein
MTPTYRGGPGRVLSLLEIMNLFNVKYCSKRVGDLARIEAEFKNAEPSAKGSDLPTSLANLQKTLRRSIRAMEGLEMERCQRQLQDILKEATTKELLAPHLAVHARAAQKAITEELHHRKFLWVAPRLSGYIDHERLFGDATWTAFPSARDDIQQSGNSLAADCNTAAVFHAMRAVEWGLRALATHLGVRRLKSHRKSGGPPKLTPVAYAQWEIIINSLPKRVERRLKRLRPGPRKQEREQFYNECIEEINAIRQAWRNHIMHSREKVIAEDAVAILAHSRRLMTKLSTRVSEV